MKHNPSSQECRGGLLGLPLLSSGEGGGMGGGGKGGGVAGGGQGRAGGGRQGSREMRRPPSSDFQELQLRA